MLEDKVLFNKSLTRKKGQRNPKCKGRVNFLRDFGDKFSFTFCVIDAKPACAKKVQIDLSTAPFLITGGNMVAV